MFVTDGVGYSTQFSTLQQLNVLRVLAQRTPFWYLPLLLPMARSSAQLYQHHDAIRFRSHANQTLDSAHIVVRVRCISWREIAVLRDGFNVKP